MQNHVFTYSCNIKLNYEIPHTVFQERWTEKLTSFYFYKLPFNSYTYTHTHADTHTHHSLLYTMVTIMILFLTKRIILILMVVKYSWHDFLVIWNRYPMWHTFVECGSPYKARITKAPPGPVVWSLCLLRKASDGKKISICLLCVRFYNSNFMCIILFKSHKTLWSRDYSCHFTNMKMCLWEFNRLVQSHAK